MRVIAARLGADAPLIGAAELAFEPLLADPAGWLCRGRPCDPRAHEGAGDRPTQSANADRRPPPTRDRSARMPD